MAEYGKAAERADGMLLTILEVVHNGLKGVVSDEQAAEVARDVVETVRNTFGGENVYVCKGRNLDSILKSHQVWADFTGDNHVELSKKYGFSVQWVYTIIRTMTKLKRDELQPDLFGDSNEAK